MDNILNLIMSFCDCNTYSHNDILINNETHIDNNIYELNYDNTHNNSDNKYYLYDDKTNEINIRDKKILIIDNFI